MKIPPGTSGGQTLRLRGQGLRREGNTRGDLLVTVNIVVPSELSKKERELFEALAKESRFRPRDTD